MEIKIGTGLGELTFGMDRTTVSKLYGEPNEKELFSYSEEEDDLTEVWHYDEKEISLSFDEADEWKLIMIAASNEEITLHNEIIIGKSFDEAVAILEKIGLTDFSNEEVSATERVIKIEEESLNIWIDDEGVSELQWGPKWSDDNTPVFPA